MNHLYLEQTIELSGPDQYGSGVPDGITAAYAAIQREAKANPTHVILALDVEKAFPSIDRG
eukprot:1872058-Prorocentrum_lima.AAC.1